MRLYSICVLLAGLAVHAPALVGETFSGIGVALSKDGDDCVVRDIIPDSPAAANKGIHRGDRIIAIAQGEGAPVDLFGMSLPKAVELIRGPKGSTIRLTVVPAGKEETDAKVIALVRGELKGLAPDENRPGMIPFTIWLIGLGKAAAQPW